VSQPRAHVGQVVVMPHDVDIGLLLSALPLCLLSRAANIFPLAAVANKLRSTPIPFNMQIMQWLCGLRGAIAYALVINLPHSDTHVSTPMAVTLICLLADWHEPTENGPESYA
jgi:NhaP-type Na+/H+ or K+/H+ antiporter